MMSVTNLPPILMNMQQRLIRRTDYWLFTFLNGCKKGYQVVVTADHGMDAHGLHGGSLAAHREVPFYLISNKRQKLKEQTVPQLLAAPLFCWLLGIAPSEKMQDIQELMRG